MSISKRVKKIEADICPQDARYGVLIYGHRCDPRHHNAYMKDGKFAGVIRSVVEMSNGKIRRMIEVDSKEGKRILLELGYKKFNKGDKKKEA